MEIVRVDVLDENTLDIQFSNDNILLLNLDLLKSDPAFGTLLEDDRILYPKTDGSSVYWKDGTRITIEKLFTLLRRSKETRAETNS